MQDTTEPVHRCDLCKRTFKQKSSLVRHTKKCTLEPKASARQKACRNCIVAKTRCDLQRPTCSRCDARNIRCAYARPASATRAVNPGSTLATNSGLVSSCSLAGLQAGLNAAITTVPGAATEVAYLSGGSDFTDLLGPVPGAIHGCVELDHFFPTVPVDASNATPNSDPGFHSAFLAPCMPNGLYGPLDIQLKLGNTSAAWDAHALPIVSSSSTAANNNRNLLTESDNTERFSDTASSSPETPDVEPMVQPMIPKPTRVDSTWFVNNSTQTLLRTLRSWPRMLAKGIQLPPVMHYFHVYDDEGGRSGDGSAPKHTSRCITLCKMWVGQSDDSGQIVHSAVRGEIDLILSKYRTYDPPTLLAAMQSLLMLLVILVFPTRRQTTLSAVPGEVFAGVRDMAFYVLSTGLMLPEEAAHTRPPWRSWAHIEGKRRTLVLIYFLHWAYSIHHGTQHLNCLQLARVLVPGPKWLWQATDEKTWMGLYSRWLVMWDAGGLRYYELFLADDGPAMTPRLETWYEDADELGTLLMAMLNTTRVIAPGAHDPLDGEQIG
ncbi:hypothetical protein GGR50DRAFT_137494 [Xylaria sp. CBS 124048]|nr:hypothetical protein GGR50DRAFT_137494 [Xylaria sp. CBS 124048]